MPICAVELNIELETEKSKVERGKTLARIYITKYTNKTTGRIGYIVINKNLETISEHTL